MLRIKEILKEKGLSVKLLAGMVELTPQNLSKLINERSKPSIGTFERIAKALNVPISDLFDTQKNAMMNCPHCGKPIKLSKG